MRRFSTWIPLAASASAISLAETEPNRVPVSPTRLWISTLVPSTCVATFCATSFSCWDSAAHFLRSCSTAFRFPGVASRARFLGSRKFRAYPSFTETTSPRVPRPRISSIKMTFIGLTLSFHIAKIKKRIKQTCQKKDERRDDVDGQKSQQRICDSHSEELQTHPHHQRPENRQTLQEIQERHDGQK